MGEIDRRAPGAGMARRLVRPAMYALALGLVFASSRFSASAHDIDPLDWVGVEFGASHAHASAGGSDDETGQSADGLLQRAAAGDGACQQRLAAFARFPGTVSARCEGDWLIVDAPTGLPPASAAPEDRIMVGIQAWIQRVPIPYAFHWRLPLAPRWVSPPEYASPRGPIAVAVDGVPIFHYDRRPNANTDPSRYEARHDTVPAGELDQCGGHAGQGDDYHYHYPPVCLIDPADLDQPIAFGLDGVPIYFGTGGDAFFGRGRTVGIDNLPPGGLDACNGARQPDGSYVYYTTAEPPYVLGCHHAHADPSLRIEPRPLRGRDQRRDSPLGVGEIGEAVRTLVTDFRQDPDGWYVLEFNALSGGGTGAVRYRSAGGNDCWEFEYRPNAAVAGSRTTVCR